MNGLSALRFSNVSICCQLAGDPLTRRAVHSLVVLATAVCLPAIALAESSGPISIDISAGPGREPADFTFWRTGGGEIGKWTIVADPTAANGRAIAQVSNDRTDYRFPLAVYKPYTGQDLEVSMRFKAVAGTVDKAGGVAVRLLTPDDYYVARANALEDNVRFYRVVKGKRQQLAGANIKVTANAWHTLGLKADGDRFTVSFDGQRLISARDRTFAEAGKVALWTKADSVTHFDTISITPLKQIGSRRRERDHCITRSSNCVTSTSVGGNGDEELSGKIGGGCPTDRRVGRCGCCR